jgi:hypothetical protein
MLRRLIAIAVTSLATSLTVSERELVNGINPSYKMWPHLELLHLLPLQYVYILLVKMDNATSIL